MTKAIVITIVACAMMWALLSGRSTFLIVALGLVTVTFAVLYSLRLKLIGHFQFNPLILFRVIRYSGWLSSQIFHSNIAVCRAILKPKSTLDPMLIETSSAKMSSIERVTFANSITLTPGTVSVELLTNEKILVHALDGHFSDAKGFEDMRKNIFMLANKKIEE